MTPALNTPALNLPASFRLKDVSGAVRGIPAHHSPSLPLSSCLSISLSHQLSPSLYPFLISLFTLYDFILYNMLYNLSPIIMQCAFRGLVIQLYSIFVNQSLSSLYLSCLSLSPQLRFKLLYWHGKRILYCQSTDTLTAKCKLQVQEVQILPSILFQPPGFNN